ncbi:MAG: RNA polymerase sigma factor [Sphingobium sp.]
MPIDEDTSPPDAGLKQLCLAKQDDLKRFLLARGASAADAEDLLQDLYIRIDTTVTGPIKAPKAYLYQMLNNMMHTRYRTETRRQRRDADWIKARHEDSEIEERNHPENVLSARDELMRVEQCLHDLPERTSFIFRQYRIEGSSQKDIAQLLGVSLSAVEKHLQRAYKAVLDIRRHLDAEGMSASHRDGGWNG